MKAYKIVTPDHNEKTNKTYWREIGTLFAPESATGINGASIKLNMFPELMLKVYHRDEPKQDWGGSVDELGQERYQEPVNDEPDEDENETIPF